MLFGPYRISIVLLLTLLCVSPALCDAPAEPTNPAKSEKIAKPATAPLDDKTVNEALAIINDMMPQMSQQLAGLRTRDPKRFDSLLRRLLNQKVGNLMRLKQADSGAYQLQLAERKYDLKCFDLARRIRNANDKQLAALSDDLRAALEDLFQARLRTREYELKKLEDRLADLSNQIKLQQDQKQALIEKRYDELLAAPNPPDDPTTPSVKNDPSGSTLARPIDQTEIKAPNSELTAEQIDQMLKILAEHRPKLADELSALRVHDPDQFSQAINQFAPRLRKLIAQRRFDPQGVDLQTREKLLHAQAAQLAKQVKAPELHEANTLREKLRNVLEAQFDARQQLLEHELAKLQSRIVQARDDLENQRSDEERFVNDRFDHLTKNKK